MTIIRTEPPKGKPLKPRQKRHLVLSFQLPDPRNPGRTVRVTKSLVEDTRDGWIVARKIRREVEAQLALGHFDAVIARFPTSRRLKRLGLLAEPTIQKPTLGALCTEWLEQKRTHGRARATIATYAHLLKRVHGDALAGRRADLVTAGDIEGLIERLRDVAQWSEQAPYKRPTNGSIPFVPTTERQQAAAINGPARAQSSGKARALPAGQINRIVWILSSAYAMGEKRYELTRNPARLVERMDAQHKRPTDPFSADEVKRILEAADERQAVPKARRFIPDSKRPGVHRVDGEVEGTGQRLHGRNGQIYNLVIVAIGTGMRIEELFGLKWSAVNFDANCIDIIETHSRYGWGKPKTPGSLRRLDMSASVRAALNAQRAISLRRTLENANGSNDRLGRRGANNLARLPDARSEATRQSPRLDTEIVFPSRALTPMDHNNFGDRAWPELLERARVPYRPFGKCRHTFAVLMREQMGAQDRDIARQLGHTTLDMMINHYLRWSPDRQGKAADVIANLGATKVRKANVRK